MEDLDMKGKSYLRDRTVLVTGASGFIGSHLAERLIEEGAEVHVLNQRDCDLFRLREVASRLTMWTGDLTDDSSVGSCIRGAKPQVVFHLATVRNVERDLKLASEMIDTNVKGTVTLIRTITEENIPLERFINTGTCEEYGDGRVPFQEDMREIPVSPYSASKVAATYFCRMIHKTMNTPIITLRPFLAYGPKQDNDMFIPSLIRHCLTQQDFLMTVGDQTREFNYVGDIVDAYILAAGCDRAVGEIINIGNGQEYKILDVAEMIVRMIGNPIRLRTGALPKRAGETEHFFCSNQKAKTILGWKPKTPLDEGLKKTINWYRRHKETLARVIPRMG